MRVGFVGLTHLGQTLKKATEIMGFDTEVDKLGDCDLVFIAPDILDHKDLSAVDKCVDAALMVPDVPLVLVSQVPPGYTRSKGCSRLFYQVDTIIMSKAIQRMVCPERIIVGGPGPLPPRAYLEWLAAFNCPIFYLSYESAELAKLAVNFYLAAQVGASTILAEVAEDIGADWASIIPAVAMDKRMGSYLLPGELNQHLLRDVHTVEEIHARCADDRGRREDRSSTGGETEERRPVGSRYH